jgi:hypothetical protein
MRWGVATLALCLISTSAQAQDAEEEARALDAPATDDGGEGFSTAFREAHPPPEHPAPSATTTDWDSPLSLAVGAALVYELGVWPSAVLFGEARTHPAPGGLLFFAVRYGLTRILELNVEAGLRFLHFGDFSQDTSPGAPIARDVSLLSPSVALSARLRPASRFYLGAGLGVGFGWLFGEATDTDGVLAPFGDRSGAVGELRGEVGFLVGPKTNWDVGARLRFVGYPQVPGTTTLSVALEIALTVPVWP